MVVITNHGVPLDSNDIDIVIKSVMAGFILGMMLATAIFTRK